MTKEEIQSIFGSRIVSFHAVFAKAIGSVPAAVMLSQAFFWQEKAKSKDGVKIGEEMFFSKTGDEWYEETGLTESQQLTARKHLLSAGFWMEQRAGLPAKMCYRIDVESLVAVISRYLKTGQQVAVDNRKQSREITRTSSGKFRQLEAEKNGNNIKVENKGALKGELKGENGAAEPLLPPYKKVADIYPETLEADEQPEPTSPGGGAIRVSITGPEHPDISVNDVIEPKTKPEKSGRGKSKNPRNHEPTIHPENEVAFQHFNDPVKARAAWVQWIKYKFEQFRDKYKSGDSELICLRKHWKDTSGDAATFEKNISHSIGSLYKGIFPPKEEKVNGTQPANGNYLNVAQRQHLNLAHVVAKYRQAAMDDRNGNGTVGGAPTEWEV